MNTRERFNAIMAFEQADRGLFTPYMGPWPATVERWRAEGLGDRHWAEPFGFDVSNEDVTQFAFLPVEKFVWPPLEEKVLREEPGRRLVRDRVGVTKYVRTDGVEMAQYISHPVCDRASWETFKEHLHPETPGRLPDDLDERARREEHRDTILGIGGRPMGFFSAIRELMGAEAALVAAALEPDLLGRIAEHLADLWIDLFSRVMAKVQPDFLFLWELNCDNKGPMLSPAMFRDLFLPSYRKLIGALKDLGLRNVWVDCQGNAWKMLPLFLETGVTGTLPLEVRSGMDVAEVRRRFPRLQMIGGIARLALAGDRADIDRELDRVAPLVALGGYIPTIDHFFSPEIPWDNFRHFIAGLRRITSVPIRPTLTAAVAKKGKQ